MDIILIFEKLDKLWNLMRWRCTCPDGTINKRCQPEDQSLVTRSPGTLCKICFGKSGNKNGCIEENMNIKEDSNIEENSKENTKICTEKKQKVTEVVDKMLGLNDLLAFASNEPTAAANSDFSEAKEFLGDVVKLLVAGDHMDDFLEQDYPSQQGFLAQTLDEIFEYEETNGQHGIQHDDTVFINGGFDDELPLVDVQNPKLSIVVNIDGKPVGKVCLHGSQVKLKGPTKSYMARQSSSSIVPIPITSEIRKTIRMFPFENFDDDMQNFGTISLCGKIFKMYQLYVDQPEPVSIQTFKEDTVDSLLKRLDIVHSSANKKVIGLFADHKLLKRESNLWTTVGKYDKLNLSFGNISHHNNEAKSVYLQALDGTQIYIDVMDDESSDSFMNRVTVLLEVKEVRLNFNYRCKRITEGSQLSDYNLKREDIIHFSLPSLGGQGKLFLSFDLSDVSVKTGVGTFAEYGYTYGLNVIGNCRNVECPSAGDVVYYSLGYPEMEIMNTETNEYRCPRCLEQEITIRTFLMAAGRAKFSFRKIGKEKDEVIFLESPSADHTHYSQFNVNNCVGSESGVEYDFVRIYTVKFDLSFNKCQGCERSIHLNDEEIAECGRAFHTSCFQKSEENRCPTCKLPEMSLDELQSKATVHSTNLKIPNKVFGECEIHYTSKQNIDQGSLNDFLEWMNRNDIFNKHFADLIDMQQKFVKQNLDQLIQITRVGTNLMADLISRDVLSSEDQMHLDSELLENKKASETYRIVSQKLNGLIVMYEALEKSKQSGAAAVLKNFVMKLKIKFNYLISKQK